MPPRWRLVRGEHLHCPGPIAGDDFRRASCALFQGLQRHGCAIVQLPIATQAVLFDCRLRMMAFFQNSNKRLYTKQDAAAAGTGYVQLDGKELFEVLANPRLAEELPEALAHTVTQALASLDAISRAALTAATSAPELAANPAAFQALLDPLPSSGTCSSVLQISHYQPSVAATPANLEHVDRGILTFVSDDATGLEVKGPDGSWHPVELGISHVAVMVGHTLEVASNGAFKACRHRAVQAKEGGSGRLSFSYKARANPAARLDAAVLLQPVEGRVGTAPLSRELGSARSIPDVMRAFEDIHASLNQLQHQAAAAARRPADHIGPSALAGNDHGINPAAGTSGAARMSNGAQEEQAQQLAQHHHHHHHHHQHQQQQQQQRQEQEQTNGRVAGHGSPAAPQQPPHNKQLALQDDTLVSSGELHAADNQQPSAPAKAAGDSRLMLQMMQTQRQRLQLQLQQQQQQDQAQQQQQQRQQLLDRQRQTSGSSRLYTKPGGPVLQRAGSSPAQRQQSSASPAAATTAAATPASERPSLVLTLRALDEYELQVKVRQDITVGKLMATYCKRRGVAVDTVRFVHHGARMLETEALATYNMQPVDVIDIVMKQVGD